jgi:hypothetical protein
VGLIGLGVLWTLSNLGRLDLLPALRIFWPVMLLVWGVAELLAYAQRRGARRGPSAVAAPSLPSELGERGDAERL